MPITFTSERGGRVYLCSFGDTFNNLEAFEFIDVFRQSVLEKATRKVYVIADVTAIRHIPSNMMTTAVRMMKNTHPTLGTVIEVTPNGIINALTGVLAKLSPSGMIIVRRTVKEAFEEVDRMLALEELPIQV